MAPAAPLRPYAYCQYYWYILSIEQSFFVSVRLGGILCHLRLGHAGRKRPVCPVDQLMFGQLGRLEMVLEESLAVAGVHGGALLFTNTVPLHSVQVLEYCCRPKLDMNVRYFTGQLHGWCHHVH